MLKDEIEKKYLINKKEEALSQPNSLVELTTHYMRPYNPIEIK